jgi:hypothetical protein
MEVGLSETENISHGVFALRPWRTLNLATAIRSAQQSHSPTVFGPLQLSQTAAGIAESLVESPRTWIES